MDHTFFTGKDFHKGTERHDSFDHAVKFFTDFNFTGEIFHPFNGLIHFFLLHSGNSNRTVIIDIHRATGRGNNTTDNFAAGESSETRGASPVARIGEVISREVRMFKRGGDDLVEVILTPDTKTQISLKLQWRDGQVEVQARCDMGDHRSLNSEWSQLQASLAAHGVRLSHLSERVQTGFTEFFSNSGFSKPQGGERQSSAQQSAADALSPTVVQPAKSGGAKPAIRANHLLESWA